MENQETIREKLISIIENFAGDELDREDWIEISKESESDLVDRVNQILIYYADM